MIAKPPLQHELTAQLVSKYERAIEVWNVFLLLDIATQRLFPVFEYK